MHDVCNPDALRAEVERLNGELDAMKEAERRYGIAMAEVERLQLAFEAIAEYESPEGHIAREALVRHKEC